MDVVDDNTLTFWVYFVGLHKNLEFSKRFTFSKTCSITDFKTWVHATCQLPVEQQYVLVGSRIVGDQETIESCGITDNSAIAIYFRSSSGQALKTNKNDKRQSDVDHSLTGQSYINLSNRAQEQANQHHQQPLIRPVEQIEVQQHASPTGQSGGAAAAAPTENRSGVLRFVDAWVQKATTGFQRKKQQPGPLNLPQAVEVPPPPGWDCPACTLKNLPARWGCEACSTARPDDYEVPADYVLTDKEREILNKHDTEEAAFQAAKTREKQEALLGLQALFAVSEQALAVNVEPFECPICYTEVDARQGVVLHECLHHVCKECLKNQVGYNAGEQPTINCPCEGCNQSLLHSEIAALCDPETYEKLFATILRVAEATMENTFHCKTPDCPLFIEYEDEVNEFACPGCGKVNCLVCKVQHEEQTCKEYQDELKKNERLDNEANRTLRQLEEMIERGDAMNCPGCKIVLQKKTGCDWMMCPMCKTEICWAVRGPRWGPKGRGDTSGGCKCDYWGARCSPNCGNCH